jgi:hypothetical protein
MDRQTMIEFDVLQDMLMKQKKTLDTMRLQLWVAYIAACIVIGAWSGKLFVGLFAL